MYGLKDPSSRGGGDMFLMGLLEDLIGLLEDLLIGLLEELRGKFLNLPELFMILLGLPYLGDLLGLLEDLLGLFSSHLPELFISLVGLPYLGISSRRSTQVSLVKEMLLRFFSGSGLLSLLDFFFFSLKRVFFFHY